MLGHFSRIGNAPSRRTFSRPQYGEEMASGANDDPRRGRDVSVMDDFIYGEPQPMK